MHQQGLMLIHPTVKKIHLQKIHYLTLGSHEMLPSATKFEVAMSKGLGGGTFTIKYII